MTLPKSFGSPVAPTPAAPFLGRGTLAGQFLSYFLRFYLLVIGVGLLVSLLDDGPQVVLMKRANQAQLSRAWERVLHRADLEHLANPSLKPPINSELRRTLQFKNQEYAYEFEPEALARSLEEELRAEGWSSVTLYGAQGALTTAPPSNPFRSTARITLEPLAISAASVNSKSFANIVSPWRVGLLALAVLLFPFVTARVFARRVNDPLQALESTSRKLAEGELEARVELQADNEIGRLGTTLNWMAEQIQEREARLQELNHLKSLFLASVSHELRTPLTAILGQTQMLLDDLKGPLAPEQRDTVQKTQRNAAALLGLINDLLDLGKIEAGRMDVQKEEFQLADCVSDALESTEPQLRQKGLELEVIVPEEAWALGDYGRTRQILINLLSNATKFTEQGRIRLRAQKQDQIWCLEVQDNGLGIPADLHERIFEEFRQADSRFGGTGLGLSIARKLAQLQGGTLTVASTPPPPPGGPPGSTFRLTIPAASEILQQLDGG